MYTLVYLKWIINKVLVYSTGNSAQSYAAAWMGGELDFLTSDHGTFIFSSYSDYRPQSQLGLFIQVYCLHPVSSYIL